MSKITILGAGSTVFAKNLISKTKKNNYPKIVLREACFVKFLSRKRAARKI